jgi:RNA polymerase sigma-70 factor (ECF subfamily)
MSEDNLFADLLRRVRAGDQEAAAELVRLYEPEVRRAARIRLRQSRLRRLLDSLDVCQSVLVGFFVRAALGLFELNTPADLLRLLAVMVRNKVADLADRERAQRRDCRRTIPLAAVEGELVASFPTPSKVLAARELLQETRRRLSPDERQLLTWREQGRPWAEIARELGVSGDALRKRLGRAVDRVAEELQREG